MQGLEAGQRYLVIAAGMLTPVSGEAPFTLLSFREQFELGAVPPMPAHGDRVLVDPRVCENEDVLLEAGTHEQSLRIKSADLIALNHSLIADLCRD